MRIVLALGGNALLLRGEVQGIEQQRAHVENAALQIARIASVLPAHGLVLTHGNGPQVGLLALQAAAYKAVPPYPLDVLGAESQGMVGYLLEQALQNHLPERLLATLVTRTEVSAADPAFAAPTKPIGPMYTAAEADALARSHGWTVGADGTGWRRLVASPAPLRVANRPAIESLLAAGVLVIAAGGGGVPVARRHGAAGDDGRCYGVEAVIDKDATSSLLARELDADCLLIATDVAALALDFGTPLQRALPRTTPDQLAGLHFAAGSMGPKVNAACDFVRTTGRRAVIGALQDIEAMLAGTAGTQIERDP